MVEGILLGLQSGKEVSHEVGGDIEHLVIFKVENEPVATSYVCFAAVDGVGGGEVVGDIGLAELGVFVSIVHELSSCAGGVEGDATDGGLSLDGL